MSGAAAASSAGAGAAPGAPTGAAAAGSARNDPRGTRDDPRDRPPKPTLLQTLRLTLLDAGSTVVERVDLFMLELERAAHSAARIVALMVVAAVLGVTAWLGAWALAAMLLLALGLPIIAVMAIVVLVNAGAAWIAWRRARGLFGTLGLPATRRLLRVASNSSSRSTGEGPPTPASAPRAPADAAVARHAPRPGGVSA